jgi:Ca-activated chloride channel family protein
MSRRYPKTTARKPGKGLVIGGLVMAVVASICLMSVGIMMFNAARDFMGDDQTVEAEQPAAATWSADSAELTIAVSPVMAPVLTNLAEAFNRENQQSRDGRQLSVQVVVLDPEEIVETALGAPPFQAISPDSSLWLDELELRWNAQQSDAEQDAGAMPISSRRVGEQVRYAVSPIVLAAWEDVARSLGWPDRPVSWQDIQARAQEDGSFRWSHPNTRHASGLLAVLAEFYAGAGLTRGLTAEAATRQSTLDYVAAVQSTVRFYGEGEDVVVERLKAEGRSFLDLFVAQERVVIEWNKQNTGDRLVALYPEEGTLWTDHPLALLELGQDGQGTAVTANQRETFRSFVDFLATDESQDQFLAAGYRPADLTIALDRAGSPFAGSAYVDWRQPQTTLQMPPADVIAVVRDSWYYTKRPTNVYLVVDTSGSMEGNKLLRTQEALTSFVDQIRGNRDRVGIIEFGSGIKSYNLLAEMTDDNRSVLKAQVSAMEAYGGTALIDGVAAAVEQIQQEGSRETINAIVVMTDGQENESSRSLDDLRELLDERNGFPVVLFTIGFGDDVDGGMLQEIARLGGGQFRTAGETDIEELYRIISTYF